MIIKAQNLGQNVQQSKTLSTVDQEKAKELVRLLDKKQLDVTGLSRKKLDKLYDSNLSEDDIIGFNFSDLERISETFNLSYDYLFTGRE